MIWKPWDVAEEMRRAGWSSTEARSIGVAICRAESSLDDQATGYNYKKDAAGNYVLDSNGQRIILSRDRGLFQINDKFHPACTDEMAYDPIQNIAYARKVYVDRSFTWNPWSTFTNGAYKQYLWAGQISVEVAQLMRVLERDLRSAQGDLTTCQTAQEVSALEIERLHDHLAVAQKAATDALNDMDAAKARFNSWLAESGAIFS